MLSNTVVCWSIMHGKFLFHASWFQVQGETLVQVLVPMIGMEDLDGNAKVCHTPRLILFIGFESFRFEVKQVEVSQPRHVIGEGDIISSFSFCFNRSWSPQVRVDLIAKFHGTLTLVSLWDGFPGRFRIYTWLTKEWLPWGCWLQADASHKPVFDETSCDACRNMLHSTVELIQGKLFISYMCCFRLIMSHTV